MGHNRIDVAYRDNIPMAEAAWNTGLTHATQYDADCRKALPLSFRDLPGNRLRLVSRVPYQDDGTNAFPD
jgi:hypothetical protein